MGHDDATAVQPADVPALPRRIAHLDMDAFYASVELLRYPQLRGQAVVIGGGSASRPQDHGNGVFTYARLKDYVGRGVVTTSTYEARALGVFSAMGMMKAAKLAPDAILLPADFDSYRHYSALFKNAVREIAPDIENRSIDEIYIDIASMPGDSMSIATRLKDVVFQATGLTCSIGISSTKLVAKMCSEMNKPNGIAIIRDDEIEERIWPLAVSKINGIGPKATQKLAALGITTIAQLAHFDPFVLQENFGKQYGAWLHRSAHGLDDRPVVTKAEPKSISRETTFGRDLDVKIDRPVLTNYLLDLCKSLADHLDRKGYLSYTIGIKLRFADFHTVTRDITLQRPSAGFEDIVSAARECLRRVPINSRIRLLGIKASNLTREADNIQVEQGTLF
ncbi:DNA polymerase IV [Silvimonas iriomotensis]|uniref:DNA polymerase IV n=1 Tax=Silvimonas iriomotensis TaxID=449662 RepID=A0ABQ2PCX4_9NEIS|nr:DNA polymerase IV [Silvimonas iriomotensis]GGP23109.1 DNA polymerase IV 2 [Silvimonas iriomotensis]